MINPTSPLLIIPTPISVADNRLNLNNRDPKYAPKNLVVTAIIDKTMNNETLSIIPLILMLRPTLTKKIGMNNKLPNLSI